MPDDDDFGEHVRYARQKLGLTQRQLAAMCEMDPRILRAVEQKPGTSTRRSPPARMIRVLDAYLAGYRPSDWPLPLSADGSHIIEQLRIAAAASAAGKLSQEDASWFLTEAAAALEQMDARRWKPISDDDAGDR